MDLILKIILVLTYPVLLLARVVNAMSGRDPLRVREPESETLWVERGQQPDTASYFSDGSPVKAGQHSGLTDSSIRLLRLAARLFSPPRPAPGEKFSAAADRECGIPDEVYTLW